MQSYYTSLNISRQCICTRTYAKVQSVLGLIDFSYQRVHGDGNGRLTPDCDWIGTAIAAI
jgi:hypothetical protein